jgi:hypothetical protein
MAALKSRWTEAAPMLWLGRRSYASICFTARCWTFTRAICRCWTPAPPDTGWRAVWPRWAAGVGRGERALAGGTGGARHPAGRAAMAAPGAAALPA